MVRQKWTNEKISKIREAKANGLTLKELETKFSLSVGQVYYCIYKYRMKEPPVKFSLSEQAPEKKTFFEWLFG